MVEMNSPRIYYHRILLHFKQNHCAIEVISKGFGKKQNLWKCVFVYNKPDWMFLEWSSQDDSTANIRHCLYSGVQSNERKKKKRHSVPLTKSFLARGLSLLYWSRSSNIPTWQWYSLIIITNSINSAWDWERLMYALNSSRFPG